VLGTLNIHLKTKALTYTFYW